MQHSTKMLSLSGPNWFIHEDASGTGVENRLYAADITAPGWIPAHVPGNVQADLEAAHHLRPLSYGAGDPRLAQVAQKDWWYRRDFEVPMSFADTRLRLIFDGVDYACEVWLNDQRLGANAGMFRRFSFDVANIIRLGQTNQLAVKISRMPAELVDILADSDGKMSGGGENYPKEPGPNFFIKGINEMRQLLQDLKSPTNFGWDWGVNVFTLGIWQDVRLEATGPARIEWVQVLTELNDDHRQATIKLHLTVDSLAEVNAKATLRLRGHGAAVEMTRHATLSPGDNYVEAGLVLNDPALWWPNGQGAQPLYELETILEDRQSGRQLDRRTTRFGVRDIRWQPVEGAPPDFINPYQLVVNGRLVRMMGSNIIPPDLMFGRMNDKGLRLIRLASQAGMNTLRVWGGGALLTDAIYDLADELGIMLSQEFPLANCVPESDSVFLNNLAQTITNIVKRLRNHPCIVEWSGGNEMNWKQGDDYPALKLLEQVTSQLDNRIFRATCPIQGSRHSPWHYDPSTHYTHYNDSDLQDSLKSAPLMRYGEFGCQTPANLEVWLRDIPLQDLGDLDNPDNPVLVRKNIVEAVFSRDFWLLKPTIEALFGPIEDLAMLVEAGQFLAAEGLRYAVDATRRRGKRIGGLTTWDLNEPWPNGAGSFLVDYDGRPLMNYDFIKQAVAPVALSLKYDSILYDPADGLLIDLWAVCDSPDPQAAVRWRWLIRNDHGTIIESAEGSIALQPLDAVRIDTHVIKGCSGPVIVEVQLLNADRQLISERIHVFGDGSQEMPLGGLLNHRTQHRTQLEIVSVDAHVAGENEVLVLELVNRGSITAMFCEAHPLLVYRTDLFINQNHCCIPPNESRLVTIQTPVSSETSLSLLQTGWRISCWNADDCRIAPHESVLLALGRRDTTSGGYLEADPGVELVEVVGAFPDPTVIPALLGGTTTTRRIRFSFAVNDVQASSIARLLIHSADQDDTRKANVGIAVNGNDFSASFPCGLGIQIHDRSQLAFPATLQFDLPVGTLHVGNNLLEIYIANDSWFAWDALHLLSLPEAF